MMIHFTGEHGVHRDVSRRWRRHLTPGPCLSSSIPIPIPDPRPLAVLAFVLLMLVGGRRRALARCKDPDRSVTTSGDSLECQVGPARRRGMARSPRYRQPGEQLIVRASSLQVLRPPSRPLRGGALRNFTAREALSPSPA